ncbi:hypothetical protein LguiB_019581 [Lonicera macranthoides]
MPFISSFTPIPTTEFLHFESLLMESSNLSDNLYSSLPQDKWWGERPLYKFLNYWFRLTYLEGIQQTLKEFKPLPTDIILASFPKTGTTWLKSLLYSIVNRSSKQSLTATHPHELVPSLELQVYGPSATNYIDQQNGTGSSSRIFSTHIAYEILADVLNSSNCKVVYVTRNPKDALISLWHFIKHTEVFQQDPWPIDVAVDKFCTGVVPYGPFHEHVVGYRKQSFEKPNKVCFVTYEELKKDTSSGVKRLAEFLGCPFDKEEEVEEIVKLCSIETLKSHEVNKSNELPRWFELPYNSFFREGAVGDHKNHMSPEMIERIDAITKEKFHGSGFMFGV